MNINKFLQQHPAINYAADIRDICQPLQLLDIVYFSHVHIDANQQMSAIANVPEFFELYFNKGYHNYDLHKATQSNGEEYVLWDFVNRKKQSQDMHQDFMSFNQGHTFSIVINNKNHKDCFHFATRLGNESMNGKYLQLIGYFKNFINYFKEKVANHKQILQAYDLKMPLKQNGGFIIEGREYDINQFSESIKTKRTYSVSNNSYLTAREIECLNWIAQGKTLAETAIILNITPRTVKAHVNAIKIKLDVTNQFQLGMYYAKLNENSTM